jgi:chromosome segregation ATPase
VLMRGKEELEKVVRQVKNEALEAEKKAADYYQQLLKTQENFQVLQSETRLLSNEITAKQHETSKLERDRQALERELLQLRPLKNQLENFSQSAQKQIEESVRIEYERSKLSTALRDVTYERDQAKQELAEIQVKHATLTTQNAKLLEQLRMFEKETFELEARIRRGIEVERENHNMTKNVE